MPGFTNAEAKATLDARFPVTGATDYVAFSTDGATETGILARVAVGATNWAAATTADPSVKANAGTITTAAATGTGTVSHYAIFSASTGGTQRIDWTALATAKPFTAGDTGSFAAGALQITLS